MSDHVYAKRFEYPVHVEDAIRSYKKNPSYWLGSSVVVSYLFLAGVGGVLDYNNVLHSYVVLFLSTTVLIFLLGATPGVLNAVRMRGFNSSMALDTYQTWMELTPEQRKETKFLVQEITRMPGYSEKLRERVDLFDQIVAEYEKQRIPELDPTLAKAERILEVLQKMNEDDRKELA